MDWLFTHPMAKHRRWLAEASRIARGFARAARRGRCALALFYTQKQPRDSESESSIKDIKRIGAGGMPIFALCALWLLQAAIGGEVTAKGSLTPDDFVIRYWEPKPDHATTPPLLAAPLFTEPAPLPVYGMLPLVNASQPANPHIRDAEPPLTNVSRISILGKPPLPSTAMGSPTVPVNQLASSDGNPAPLAAPPSQNAAPVPMEIAFTRIADGVRETPSPIPSPETPLPPEPPPPLEAPLPPETPLPPEAPPPLETPLPPEAPLPSSARRWLREPVFFGKERQPLSEFLRDLCEAQGVACRVSDQVGGTVTGSAYFRDPGELLDLVARTQRFNWYYDGVIVHFFAEAEMTSRFFPLEDGHERMLRGALTDLELWDDRFPWRVTDGGRLLMAQGPAIYLDIIGDALERQEIAAAARAPERVLKLFRLRHAWATEQTLETGTGRTRIPGVADLLRQIVNEQAAESGQGEEPSIGSRTLRGTGVAARRDRDAAAPAPAAATAFIQADTRLNAVMVWDFPENMPRHQAIIEALDQPLPLVEIRAAILDVEAGRMRDVGLSWEHGRDAGANGRWSQRSGVNPSRGNDRISYDNIQGEGFQYATIYTRGLDQFMARVSALEEDGTANILSRPSVLTQDNMQAVLEHTETFYVRLEGEREVDLVDITTGLTLRVTPHVIFNQDGGPDSVQLAVHIVTGTDSDNSNRVDNLPRVRQSTITTQAVVYEGEALVIGGYYTETRRQTLSGVPFLKDIPGLGALFRRKNSENNKSERLFVLSPRILTPGESNTRPGTEGERAMQTSPGRDILDGPAFHDRTPAPDRSQLWERNSAETGAPGRPGRRQAPAGTAVTAGTPRNGRR